MLILLTFSGCLLSENEEQKANGIKAGIYRSAAVTPNITYYILR